jgi:hypothetical protein
VYRVRYRKSCLSAAPKSHVSVEPHPENELKFLSSPSSRPVSRTTARFVCWSSRHPRFAACPNHTVALQPPTDATATARGPLPQGILRQPDPRNKPEWAASCLQPAQRPSPAVRRVRIQCSAVQLLPVRRSGLPPLGSSQRTSHAHMSAAYANQRKGRQNVRVASAVSKQNPPSIV